MGQGLNLGHRGVWSLSLFKNSKIIYFLKTESVFNIFKWKKIPIKIQVSALVWYSQQHQAFIPIDCEQRPSTWRGQGHCPSPRPPALPLVPHMASFIHSIYQSGPHKYNGVFNPCFIDVSVPIFTEISGELEQKILS